MKIAKIVLGIILGLGTLLFLIHLGVNTDWMELIKNLHS